MSYNELTDQNSFPSSQNLKRVFTQTIKLSTIFLFSLIVLFSATVIQAATFTVTKTADTNDGTCDSDCSLREAIVAANNAASDDIIVFDAGVFSTGFIALGGSELTIENNGSLSINATTTVPVSVSGDNQSRVFFIASDSTVTMNNMFIGSGNSQGAVGSGFGGGILSEAASLTLNNCSIGGNFSDANGGGIFNGSGQLTINSSRILANSGQLGGGISNSTGTLTINKTEFRVNTSRSFGGGAISNEGTLNLTNSSLFSNRTTTGDGGGIYNFGTATLTNSTISSNTASQNGGGIYNNQNAALNLNSVTIALNVVTTGGSTVNGGGIFNQSPATIDSKNTIIGSNTVSGNISSDVSGTLNSLGYNLFGETSAVTITGDTTGNVLNANPQVLPYGDYGGGISTNGLKINSPAIDAGNPSDFQATDQRGVARPIDGNGDGTAEPDIGAYETIRVTAPSTFVVTNTNDDGAGSLRSAIRTANTTFGNDVINFDSNVFNTPQQLDLIDGSISLFPNGTTEVNGPGAEILSISGGQFTFIFGIDVDAIVSINNLTLREGTNAVRNFGDLTLDRMVIKENTIGGVASVGGGVNIFRSTITENNGRGSGSGIRMRFGSLNVFDSTISNNSTTSSSSLSCGGGIAMENISTGKLVNTTVSGNKMLTGNIGGGGICVSGNSTLSSINTTVVNNTSSSANSGGGIQNENGTVNIRNSIIANNLDGASNPSDLGGVIMSQGYNLIRSAINATIGGNATGNILGVDPQLTPLGNFGGLTKTHALKISSPAIDAGLLTGKSSLSEDQRSKARPFDFPSIPNVNGSDASDIGAFERQSDDVTASKPIFDFDGDGKTDVSIFRPEPGQWWYLRSSDFTNAAFAFGTNTDTLVPADYTGDGKTDVAFWRESTGEWFILRSEDSSFFGFPFGTAGDIPAPGDFDGDGKADAAVFRPSTATWFIQRSSDGGTTITTFGVPEDKPTVADFDGDGKDDIAIYRPSVSQWWQLRSTDGVIAYQFGASGDKTVQGDYTGDGKADVGVFRPSTGQWLILRSEDSSFFGFPFGTSTDIPSPGDYDGDGKFDAAVFRPSTNTWFYNGSTSGNVQLNFGIANDIPIPNVYSVE